MGLRLGVDFGVASTPQGPGSRGDGEARKKEGRRRERHGASPRCGFRSSLHAQGRGARRWGRRGGRKKGGRREEAWGFA
jgi:hypothetical protein